MFNVRIWLKAESMLVYLMDYRVEKGRLWLEMARHRKMVYEADQFVTMSPSCLKDKKGNPVYEGDIIRIFGTIYREVKCKNGALGYDMSPQLTVLCFIASNSNMRYDDAGNCTSIEIMGNKYQHTYLLDQIT